MKIKSTYLLCLLLLMSCTKNKELAFRIGKVSISKARFENIMYRFSPENDTKVTNMGENKGRKQWIEKYINDKYILAEALKKGYGRKKELKTKSEYTGKFVMLQLNGEYYKESIEKKIQLTKEQLYAAYEKMKSQYYFQFIMFDSLGNLEKHIGDSLSIKSIEEYNKIKQLCATIGGYVIDEYLIYPFLGYWDLTDTLWNMKTGQVCGPVKGMYQGMDRYFFINKVRKTTYKNIHSYDDMELLIKEVYGEIEERKLVNVKDKAILDKAKPVVNNNTLQKLTNEYTALFNKFEIDKDSLAEILNKEIITYWLQGKEVSISVHDVYNFIMCLPVRSEVTNADQIKAILKEMVLEAYYWIDAQEMGLPQTEDYIFREQERYEETIINEFLSKELFAHIKVGEDEIKQIYSSYKEDFIKPQKVVIDKLYFGDFEKAMKFLEDLDNNQRVIGKWIDNPKYNILKYNLNDTSYFDSLNFTQNVVREIKNMDIDQIVGPIYYNNEYYILIKRRELDSQVPEYNKIKEGIKSMLESNKTRSIYASKLRKYKQKYKMKSFIKFENYY